MGCPLLAKFQTSVVCASRMLLDVRKAQGKGK